MKDNLYIKDYEASYYAIDQRKRLDPKAILDYITECNLIYARTYGIALEELHKKGYTMVLQKAEISFNRPIYLGEKFSVAVGIQGVKGSSIIRQGSVITANNEVICKSRGLVYVIDINTRKVAPMPDFVNEAYNIINDENIFEFKVIPPVNRIDYYKEFDVRYSDLDLNNHVNNSIYLGWALETFPLEFLNSHSLKKARILYMKEVFYGERVRVVAEEVSSEAGLKTIHQIKNSEGVVTTLLECTWENYI